MTEGERTVRIMLQVPLSLVARIDALHRGHGRPSGTKDVIYLEALARGIAALEVGDGGGAGEPVRTRTSPEIADDILERVARGETAKAIADHLNRTGRRMEDGRRWTPAGIDRIVDQEQTRAMRDPRGSQR